jgi:hypothetical protein
VGRASRDCRATAVGSENTGAVVEKGFKRLCAFLWKGTWHRKYDVPEDTRHESET